MTDDKGLSVREAVEWCGSGVTVQEVTRLRRLTKARQAATDERATYQCGRPGCASLWRTSKRRRSGSARTWCRCRGEWATGGEGRSQRPRALAGFWYCRSRESLRTI